MKKLYSPFSLSWRHKLSLLSFLKKITLKNKKKDNNNFRQNSSAAVLRLLLLNRCLILLFGALVRELAQAAMQILLTVPLAGRPATDILGNAPTLCHLSSKWPPLNAFSTFPQPCSWYSLISFTALGIISITGMLGDPKWLRPSWFRVTPALYRGYLSLILLWKQRPFTVLLILQSQT